MKKKIKGKYIIIRVYGVVDDGYSQAFIGDEKGNKSIRVEEALKIIRSKKLKVTASQHSIIEMDLYFQ